MSPVRNQPPRRTTRRWPRAGPSSRRRPSAPAPRSRPAIARPAVGVGAGVVGQAQLDPGQREAHRAGAALAVVGVRDGEHGLGRAVALQRRLAAAGPHRGEHVGGQGRGARHAQPEAGQAREAGVGGEAAVHRGHAEEQGGAEVAGRRRHVRGVEPGPQQHRRPRLQRAVDARAQPVEVEERQRVGQAVVGLPAPGEPQGLDAGHQVAVRQQGALGGAGGARGVDEQGRVGGALGGQVAPGAGAGARTTARAGRRVEVDAGHRHGAGRRLRDPRAPLAVVDHRGPGGGVAHDVGDLGLPVLGVDRDDHHPGPQRPDVGDDRGHAGAGRDDHAVARHQPGAEEAEGRGPAALLQPAGGQPAGVGVVQRRALGRRGPVRLPRRGRRGRRGQAGRGVGERARRGEVPCPGGGADHGRAT